MSYRVLYDVKGDDGLIVERVERNLTFLEAIDFGRRLRVSNRSTERLIGKPIIEWDVQGSSNGRTPSFELG
jgi:hypothetical protein